MSIEIRTYMQKNVEDHTDPITGEVNDTTLAEDACQHFNGYINNDEIPEDYFEYASEIGSRHEIKTGAKRPGYSKLSGLINSIDSDMF